MTPQLTSVFDAGPEPVRALPPELAEQLRSSARELPAVVHLVRQGLPAPATRAAQRLIRAQRRFGLTVRAASVTGPFVPDLPAEVSDAIGVADAQGGPIIHLHAEVGDPIAGALIGRGTTLQSVYSPTGHLGDHPADVPLVVATEGVAQGLRRQRIRAHVVPPIMEEDWLRQPAAPIRTGRPVVGMLCGLLPSAGADCFISAVPSVAEARPDAAFVVVGGGPQEGPLRQRAMRRNVGDRIRFLGPTEDLGVLLRRLDIVVCPARQDVSALTALEAMTAGRPVVASRVGALADVLIQGETGRLVPPADPSAIAATVLRLLNRPQERQALVAAGRAYVARHHSSEVGVAASLQAYRSSLSPQVQVPAEEQLQEAMTS